VKVADEVISIVAGLAAQEVNGVIGMSGSFAEGLNEFLGKKSFAKGVRITVFALGSARHALYMHIDEFDFITGHVFDCFFNLFLYFQSYFRDT